MACCLKGNMNIEEEQKVNIRKYVVFDDANEKGNWRYFGVKSDGGHNLKTENEAGKNWR